MLTLADLFEIEIDVSNPANPIFLANAEVSGAEPGTHDWDQVYSDAQNTGAFPLGSAGTPALAYVTDPINNSHVPVVGDTVFATGKQRDDIDSWRWGTSTQLQKGDLAHGLAAAYEETVVNSNGVTEPHTLVYVGADRDDAGGGAFAFSVWFLQEPIDIATVNNENVFVNADTGVPLVHSEGDALVQASFDGGGVDDIVLSRWTGGALSEVGSLKDNTIDPNQAIASVNSGPINVPWPFVNEANQSMPAAGEFFEVGVDLNELFGLPASLPEFESFIVTTSNAANDTSQLADFFIGEITIAADVEVTKTADDAAIELGEQAGFEVTVSNVGTVELDDVTLSDPLPAGVTWSFDPGRTSDAAFQLSPGPGPQTLTLAAGTDLPFNASLTAYIIGTPTGTGLLENTATVAAVNENTDFLENNVATATVTVSLGNEAPVANDDGYVTYEDMPLIISAPGVMTNDTDINGDPLTATLGTTTLNGTLTFNSDGSFEYVPDPNFNGIDGFSYFVNDGSVDSNLATVTITVDPVNDAPVVVADAYNTDEDTPIMIVAPGVLGNDSDIDGDLLTASLDSDVSNGSLTLNSDGSFTYTPNSNFSGVDSFTYVANDGAVDSAPATVTITVNSVNDAPVAVADAYSTNEDTLLSISAPGVLANDSDNDGDPLTAVINSGVSNGTLTLNSNGSFDYTPNANFNGVDSFTYVANDGTVNSAPVTVTITVEPVNDAPVAAADAYNTDEDTSITIAAPGVLGNDSDDDGDSLTASVNTNVSNGSLTLNSDGSFTYTPNSNFSGVDSFTYVANDGAVDSAPATVTITVNSVNDAPVAAADAYSTNEDTLLSISAPGVLANDSDNDGDPLTAVINSGVSNGSLTLNSNGSFSYTPNANFNGIDSFTYVANDGSVDSAPVTVTITVDAVNDTPVAVADSYSVNEDTELTVGPTNGVLANDSDSDGDSLTANLVSNVNNGTLTLNSDGSFSYTPNANFNGSDSFSYRANDGTTDSNLVTVTITVNAVNDAPVAVADAYSTDEDTPLSISAPGVLINDSDVDGDSLTAALQSNVSNGTLTLSANGSFSYTPSPGFFGIDSFTYAANDGTSLSSPATVTITVNEVDDPPVAIDDAYVTDEDVTLNVPADGVLANDIDPDSVTLTAILGTAPSNGSLTLNSDGSFSYTPALNYFGTDSFTYRANDGTSDSNLATVTITIIETNDPPVAEDDFYSTDEDTPFTSTVSLFDNDSDDDGIIMMVSPPNFSASGAFLSINPTTGQFSYDPTTSAILQALPAGDTGTDIFTYTLSDGSLTDTATVTITVDGVNDAPTAVDDTIFISPSVGSGVLDVLANDSDIDFGDTLTIVSVTSPTPFGTISFTGTEINFDSNGTEGVATLEYTVEDPSGATDTASVRVIVSDGPCILIDTHLLCIGTPAGDRMVAEPTFGGVNVRYNLDLYGPFSPVNSIEFLGLAGNDQLITRAPQQVTFDGGTGNDYLAGSTTDDLMIGGLGNDRILGGEGNNVLYGDEVNATLFGGNDEAQGRSGDDLILGGPGNDQLIGQSGNDILSGEAGRDEIFGGLGDDFSFDSGAGDFDTIRDEGGNDIIFGGGGSDRLSGGLDEDLIIGGLGGEEWIRGDGGNDTLINGGSSLESLFDRALAELAAGDSTQFDTLILPGITAWQTNRTVNFGTIFDDGEIDWMDGLGGNDLLDAEVGIDYLNNFRPSEDTLI